MSFAAVRAVLFDAGNTLVDLDHAFIADVLEAAGFAVDVERLRRAEYDAKAWVDRNLGKHAVARDDATRRFSYFGVLLEALGIDGTACEQIAQRLEREHARSCLWRVVAPDTPPTLAALRERGYRLGVISNADGRIEELLNEVGLGSYFEAVIDSQVVGVEKPFRRIFEIGLSAVDAAARETLYVGDIYSIDVVGAREAGLEAVLLDPLGEYNVACPKIRSLEELLPLLPGRP